MKHRALVIGAGRIGAGWQWTDTPYTHAGAYRALSERVDLVGFVEPDEKRRVAAVYKWNVPAYSDIKTAINQEEPDIVSVCVQPMDQSWVMFQVSGFRKVRGIWCEKPYVTETKFPGLPIQVNYMRRGDPIHRAIPKGGKLIVYGKDDIHTKCHFEDLANFLGAGLDYRPFYGPCAYVYQVNGNTHFFDSGGVDGGECFKAMLTNLLDHVDIGTPLWSPAHA